MMKVMSFVKANMLRKEEDVVIVDISIGKGMKWIKGKEMIKEVRLAPTHKLHDGFKNGEISEEEYVKIFKELYISREMKDIIEEYERKYDNVIYCCFCGQDKFCHKNLLKSWVENGGG